MSEPTIKPFMVTMERGEDGKVFWREHYTRDDLVAVAREACEAGLCGEQASRWSGPEDIVERLTGVKR